MEDPTMVRGLGALDFSVMAAYLLGVFALGAKFAKRQHSTRDFFLADRSLGVLPIALSLIATVFSAISLIGSPSATCIYGLTMVAGSFMILFTIPIVTRVFIPFYARLKVYSAYEYLERRFDVRVRCLASAMFIFWRLCWMGLALYVPCLALHTALGLEGVTTLYLMILTLGLVATAYTVLGGMAAVVWTDVAQFGVFFGGVALAILFAITHVPDGLSGVWEFAGEQGLTRLTAELPRPETLPSAWAALQSYFTQPITLGAIVCGMLITQTAFSTVDQVTIQRYLASRGMREASRSFVVNALGVTLMNLMLALLGLSLFAFYRGVLPEGIAGRGWDGIFPYFTAHEIWPGVAGLIIGALFASTMSSVDSGINSVSNAVLVDFHQRLLLNQRYPTDHEGNAGQNRRQLTLARWLTVICGCLATLLACFVRELGDNIIQITNTIVNNFCGPMLGIFLLGIFTRRASPWGVLIGPVAGVVAAFVLTAPLRNFGFAWQAGVSPFWASAIGLIVTLVLGYGLSLMVNLISGPPAEDKLVGVTWNNRVPREAHEVTQA